MPHGLLSRPPLGAMRVLSEDELMREEMRRAAERVDVMNREGVIRKPRGMFEHLDPSPYDSGIPALMTPEAKSQRYLEKHLGLGPENIVRGGGFLGRGVGFRGLLGGRRFGLSSGGRKRMIKAAEGRTPGRGLLSRAPDVEMYPDRPIVKDPIDFLKGRGIPGQPGFFYHWSDPRIKDTPVGKAEVFMREHLSGSHFSERVGAVFQPGGVMHSRYQAGGRASEVASAFMALPAAAQSMVRRAVKDSTDAALKDLGVPEQFVVFRASDPNPNLALTPVTLSRKFAQSALDFTSPARGVKVTAHIINRSDVVASVQHLKHRGSQFGGEYELLVPRKVLEKRPSSVRYGAASPEGAAP